MANQDYGDQIVIFKNIKKADGSKQPDAKAFITIGGKKYEAGLWNKEGARGTFMAGKIIPAGSFVPKPQERDSARPQEEPKPPIDTGYNKPLPF